MQTDVPLGRAQMPRARIFFFCAIPVQASIPKQPQLLNESRDYGAQRVLSLSDVGFSEIDDFIALFINTNVVVC
jgi:hypothetical protein